MKRRGGARPPSQPTGLQSSETLLHNEPCRCGALLCSRLIHLTLGLRGLDSTPQVLCGFDRSLPSLTPRLLMSFLEHHTQKVLHNARMNRLMAFLFPVCACDTDVVSRGVGCALETLAVTLNPQTAMEMHISGTLCCSLALSGQRFREGVFYPSNPGHC